MPMRRGFAVAVHPAAGKRACGGETWRPASRSGPGVTIVSSAASRVGGLRRVRGIEVNPDAWKGRVSAHVLGPGTVCAGAGPDLMPAAARGADGRAGGGLSDPRAGWRTSRPVCYGDDLR